MTLGAAYGASMVMAQAVSAEGEFGGYGEIPLQSSALMQEHLPAEVRQQLPTFVSGDAIEGKLDGATVIEGHAELRRHDTVIKADRLEYNQNTGDANAKGDVVINSQGDRFSGPELDINLNTREGHFESPKFDLLKNHGTGDAKRIDFQGPDNFQAHEARYSTCRRPLGSEEWNPDWLVRAKQIDLDTAEDVGTARGGVLEFKGVPIIAAPYFTFPLSDARKTGALSPSFGLDDQNGFQVTAPYYLNLAPNYDATITPTAMTKRGVDMEGEFRYLSSSYVGQVTAAVMPSDKLRDDDRWLYSLQHVHRLTDRQSLVGPWRLRLNLNRVSDDNYWSDFDRLGSSTSSRLLKNDAVLSWSSGNWAARVGAHKYQTLQNEGSIITPPYDRLPSLRLAYDRANHQFLGQDNWRVSFFGGVTRFRRSAYDVSDAQIAESGDRVLTIGEVSRRWEAPGWYVEPKLRLHATSYKYVDATGIEKSTTRSLPTVSVDSGLVFERPAAFFGRSLTQTLEPRAFFTWTPYKDQSDLPNFDSGRRDFNLSTMFAESAFSGNDRISDTRGVTLGVNSRLIDPNDGAELLRMGVAQRYLAYDQNVTLPGGTPVEKGFSDMLFSARVNWNSRWSMHSNVQYNPDTKESVRTTIGGRYTPGPYRSFSAAYRIQKDVSESLDLGWQWPLSALTGSSPEAVPGGGLGPGQWYTVGRVNYSLPDRKVVDLVAGLEYDAGCWIGRMVVEREQTTTSSANHRILFQLEFTDFSRIGAGSLQRLRQNVPRYQDLRGDKPMPSRFEQYD
ncbi:LPS-assembly protein LptD [Hydrogenophaga sp. 5NK40-0174]|uniref:LPS-assembly protein LptD n=1 Tax=Hydrogenophaga sp. 5NK40-0174 TaxID=3127649 RepID=UPI0031072714